MTSKILKAALIACSISAALVGAALADDPAKPATPPPAANGDEYSKATPGATVEVSEKQFLKDSENLACEGTLCKLFAVTVKQQKFIITTYLGQGNPMMNGGGQATNIFYGGGGTTDGNGNAYNPYSQLGYGIQITWEQTNCTKTVNVDKSVYEAVSTYMQTLVNHKVGEDPTYPAFTPAEQTMILFYTTVMNLVKGTTCN